jgi:demethoxyubiquinone hydroxylase (CLK1/Coq7/Cat5 family)
MRFRTRNTIAKYATLLLFIWILYGILFGIRIKNQKYSYDHEFIEKVVEKIKEHQNEELDKLEGIDDKNIKILDNRVEINLKDDHDHPIQEVRKAEEQAKIQAGKIQINAPADEKHDYKAPGNNKFYV